MLVHENPRRLAIAKILDSPGILAILMLSGTVSIPLDLLAICLSKQMYLISEPLSIFVTINMFNLFLLFKQFKQNDVLAQLSILDTWVLFRTQFML